MPTKHALLVQAHQDIRYFMTLAKRQPNVNIYVHLDAKSDYFPTFDHLPNLWLIENRVAVYWGGFSQIRATLKLFESAFANPDNAFFHLVSGEDVLLQDFATIEQNWQYDFNFAMMLTCKIAPQYGYRFIMDSPHADTAWQRSFKGKIMTKAQQAKAKMSPCRKPVYFGSQWFSVTRDDWAKILPFIAAYSEFFAKKLVPDEHFFQTLINEKLSHQISLSNDNKRFIIFDKHVNNGNSPIYLDMGQLAQAKNAGFWFARKVKTATALTWGK